MAYRKVIKNIKGVELQMVVKGGEISTDQVGPWGYPNLLDVLVLDFEGYSRKTKESFFILLMEGK